MAMKDYDLWALDRTATGWSAPKHLGTRVNSEAAESTTSIAADGTLSTSPANAPAGRGAAISTAPGWWTASTPRPSRWRA